MNGKTRYVSFGDKKLEGVFERLKNGNSEQKQLYNFIDRAIDDLKKDHTCGIKIPKKLWPRRYVITYKIDNLWKYDLPGAWRLIYTIVADKIKIISLILEWMSHKEYEQRFGY